MPAIQMFLCVSLGVVIVLLVGLAYLIWRLHVVEKKCENLEKENRKHKMWATVSMRDRD